MHLDELEVGEMIGKGRFAKVYKVRHRPTEETYALKVLRRRKLQRYGAKRMPEDELNILRRLEGVDGIIGLIDHFEDNSNVYIVFEYAPGGSLFDELQRGDLSESRVVEVLHMLVPVIQHLHELKIVHRDIKPENLLLAADGSLKVADFGLAKYSSTNCMWLTCGTLDYQAPEIAAERAYGREVDLWSVGVLTYELLVGSAPFWHESDAGTRNNIRKVRMHEFPDHVSNRARDFVRKVGSVSSAE